MITRKYSPLLLAFVSLVPAASDVRADQRISKAKSQVQAIESAVQPFDLEQVRLLNGPFKKAMERDRAYLHALDADRLLHSWRVNAGLPSKAEPLGGWERPDCELRGHTLGHYLSACALMVASTGDEALKQKADAIVAELGKCQEALAANGYLSAFPESFIERAEKRQPVWAPFYTLHKVFAGLQDMYVHCHNQQALEVVTKMAQWLKGRLSKLDQAQMQAMLERTEQGGMNETLANLYSLTGNEDDLMLARQFNQKRYVDPLAAGRDNLEGEHANSFIPNMVGTARLYEVAGDERDRTIAGNFWNLIRRTRMYCTGGTSEHEHWQGSNELPLSDFTQETCCTYNMLKLTRHLFCWNPQSRYADYYERALWNSILSTQHPRSGMMMYFVPLAPGRWKMFNLPNDAFWCCTGTGIENHARYGEGIYFHDNRRLLVNQFIASKVNWKEKGVTVRQETLFPERENTTFTVEADEPVAFTLSIRVPSWATKDFSVSLNGEPVEDAVDSCGYVNITKTWTERDRVEVALPMALHSHAMPNDKTHVALMYGPFVLAGKLGSEGLTQENTHTGQNWYRFHTGEISSVLIGDVEDLDSWIQPVKDAVLTFETAGMNKPYSLVPYHRLFGERYAIYWHVYAEDSQQYHRYLEQLEREKELAGRTIDRVIIGDADSERRHNLQGENTESGLFTFGKPWRHATDGKWFSYDVKVLPNQPATLVCTYWGSDAGSRVFDILLDGEKLATQRLENNQPGQFFDVQYPVPARLTRGKNHVTVRFQAHPDATAGGVFGLWIYK